MSPTDDELRAVILLVEHGLLRTWLIATKLRWRTPAARRSLRRLEQAGLVENSTRYSAVNDLAWSPTPAGRAYAAAVKPAAGGSL